MTIEDFKKLETALKDAGYKRYNSPITTNDFYYCKGFEYYVDDCGETHPAYQVLFLVWDFTKYNQVPEHDNIGVEVRIMPNFDNRNDLVLSRENYDIKEIERIAEDFYAFAVTYLRNTKNIYGTIKDFRKDNRTRGN